MPTHHEKEKSSLILLTSKSKSTKILISPKQECLEVYDLNEHLNKVFE
jgi:hypothetical protein